MFPIGLDAVVLGYRPDLPIPRRAAEQLQRVLGTGKTRGLKVRFSPKDELVESVLIQIQFERFHTSALNRDPIYPDQGYYPKSMKTCHAILFVAIEPYIQKYIPNFKISDCKINKVEICATATLRHSPLDYLKVLQDLHLRLARGNREFYATKTSTSLYWECRTAYKFTVYGKHKELKEKRKRCDSYPVNGLKFEASLKSKQIQTHLNTRNILELFNSGAAERFFIEKWLGILLSPGLEKRTDGRVTVDEGSNFSQEMVDELLNLTDNINTEGVFNVLVGFAYAGGRPDLLWNSNINSKNARRTFLKKIRRAEMHINRSGELSRQHLFDEVLQFIQALEQWQRHKRVVEYNKIEFSPDLSTFLSQLPKQESYMPGKKPRVGARGRSFGEFVENRILKETLELDRILKAIPKRDLAKLGLLDSLG